MIVYLHSSPSFANFSEGPTLSPKPSYSSSHFPGTSFAFFTTRYTTAGFFDTTLFRMTSAFEFEGAELLGFRFLQTYSYGDSILLVWF